MSRFSDDERKVLLAIAKSHPRPAMFSDKTQRLCAEHLTNTRLLVSVTDARGTTYKLSETGRAALMREGIWPGTELPRQARSKPRRK